MILYMQLYKLGVKVDKGQYVQLDQCQYVYLGQGWYVYKDQGWYVWLGQVKSWKFAASAPVIQSDKEITYY